MGLDDLVPDVREAIEEFQEAKIQSAKIPAVYVIFSVKTGEPLYIGETGNLFQRITNHHLGRAEGDLRKRIENDPELNVETEGGDLWSYTEVKWIRVEGGVLKRKRIERAMENLMGPRFPSG